MTPQTSPQRKPPRRVKEFKKEALAQKIKCAHVLLDGTNTVSGRMVNLTALPRGTQGRCDECGAIAAWHVEELAASNIVENFPRPSRWYWCGRCPSPTWHKGDPTPDYLRPLGD